VPAELFHQPLALPLGELAVLDHGRFSRLLDEGARVTIFAVDELDEGRAAVTSRVAEMLGRATSMRAVATWSPGTAPPCRLPHHQLVLHLSGTRRWTIDDGSSVVVEPGDVLHIPAAQEAGWCDIVAPALHAVIDVAPDAPRTLFALLHQQLAEHELLREDLPVTASVDEQAAYAERVRQTLLHLLRGAPAPS
jgi:quercetin dioxygenase-like cupin family protein